MRYLALIFCLLMPSIYAATPAVATAPDATKPALLILGPQGLGELKLGMKWAKGNAVGHAVHFSQDPTVKQCSLGHFVANPKIEINLSKNQGIVVIRAHSGVKTPEGIVIGATLAEVKKAYPDIGSSDVRTFSPTINVPGNDKALYRFVFDAQQRLTQIVLISDDQDCLDLS